MSKRRKRKSQNQPNLPEVTLERARREAGLIEDDAPETEAIAAAEPAKPKREESLPPVQKRKRRRDVAPEELSHEEIIERLAHPTRFVTEDQLRAQYTYVTADLRSMGMLAGLLFIIMIVVARFL
jgi:hypothetical protein